MMEDVLAKVRCKALGRVVQDRRLLGLALVLVWGLGPLLMVTLTWPLLPDQPEFQTGLVMIGLAACIAMVLIWIDPAGSGSVSGRPLVAINSILQVLV